MRTEQFKRGLPALLVLMLAACGTPSQTMSTSSYPSTPVTTSGASTTTTSTTSSATGYGVVEAINLVQQPRSGVGLGTVAGAVVGGVLGNQVGSGSGRTAATIAGAAGGGLAGHQMEQNAAGGGQAYQVTVRMDNGAAQTITQQTQPSVQIGDRVRLADGVIVERVR